MEVGGCPGKVGWNPRTSVSVGIFTVGEATAWVEGAAAWAATNKGRAFSKKENDGAEDRSVTEKPPGMPGVDGNEEMPFGNPAVGRYGTFCRAVSWDTACKAISLKGAGGVGSPAGGRAVGRINCCTPASGVGSGGVGGSCTGPSRKNELANCAKAAGSGNPAANASAAPLKSAAKSGGCGRCGSIFVLMVVANFNVVECSDGIVGQDGCGAVQRDKVLAEAVLVNAREAHGEAGGLFAR